MFALPLFTSLSNYFIFHTRFIHAILNTVVTSFSWHELDLINGGDELALFFFIHGFQKGGLVSVEGLGFYAFPFSICTMVLLLMWAILAKVAMLLT